MKCPYCDFDKLVEKARFCSYCGGLLPSPPPPRQFTQPLPNLDEVAPKRRNCDGVIEKEEAEILNLLKKDIESQSIVIFDVNYAETDQKHCLPPGTTEKYLEKAAIECGCFVEVVPGYEGEGWVVLRRWNDGVIPRDE